MAEIVTVVPKREVEKYRDVTITYAFEPSTSLWGFTFRYTQAFAFDGTAKGLAEARREAHNKIDKLNGD